MFLFADGYYVASVKCISIKMQVEGEHANSYANIRHQIDVNHSMYGDKATANPFEVSLHNLFNSFAFIKHSFTITSR